MDEKILENNAFGEQNAPVNQEEVNKLVMDASKFETLSNRPLVITTLDTGSVIYAGPLLDRYQGFSHQQYMREGRAYMQRFVDRNLDWMQLVEGWRNGFKNVCLANGFEFGGTLSPYYAYDMATRNPVTGLAHKVIVRSACLRMSEGGTVYLASTYFDVTALKRGHRLFFHSRTAAGLVTHCKNEEDGSVTHEAGIMTEADTDLLSLMRMMPLADVAARLGVKSATVQTRLKNICKKTDAVGLHGLVQICDAMGWC